MKIKIPNEQLLIILLTVLLILIITLLPSSVLRVALGLPALFLFPGYALLSALFPRRNALSNIEWTVFTLGISIAVVSLIGIILNYTPWGLTVNTVLNTNAIFIVVAAVFAWFRRYRLNITERFVIQLNIKLPLTGTQNVTDKVISGILLFTILGAAVAMIYAYAAPKEGEKFTEFYILGPNGKAVDYPQELYIGQESTVIVGIINREDDDTKYRISVEVDGQEKSALGPITLTDGEKWEQLISFIPDKVGDNLKLDFFLYKNEGIEPYLKSLHLWINVKSLN